MYPLRIVQAHLLGVLGRDKQVLKQLEKVCLEVNVRTYDDAKLVFALKYSLKSFVHCERDRMLH